MVKLESGVREKKELLPLELYRQAVKKGSCSMSRWRHTDDCCNDKKKNKMKKGATSDHSEGTRRWSPQVSPSLDGGSRVECDVVADDGCCGGSAEGWPPGGKSRSSSFSSSSFSDFFCRFRFNWCALVGWLAVTSWQRDVEGKDGWHRGEEKSESRGEHSRILNRR